MVTSNDAEFKKFMVKFTNKTAPRPVTATEVSSHYIFTPILIFILTKETLITETLAMSKHLYDSWINFANFKIKKILGKSLLNGKTQEYMFIK